MPARDPNTTLHAMASGHSPSLRSVSGENIILRSPRNPGSPAPGATNSGDMATPVTFAGNLPSVFDVMGDEQGSPGPQHSPHILPLGPPLMAESYVAPFSDPGQVSEPFIRNYLSIAGSSFM